MTTFCAFVAGVLLGAVVGVLAGAAMGRHDDATLLPWWLGADV